MGRLAYILDAMDAKPSHEQLTTQAIVDLRQQVIALRNELAQVNADSASKSEAIIGAITSGNESQAQEQKDAQKGAQEAIDSLTSKLQGIEGQIEAQANTIKALDTKTLIKSLQKSIDGINHEDVMDRLNTLEISTLLAFQNIEQPDLSSIGKKLDKLSKDVNQSREYDFDITRDPFDGIAKVVAKQK